MRNLRRKIIAFPGMAPAAALGLGALLLSWAGCAGSGEDAPARPPGVKPPACVIDIDKTITDPASRGRTAKKAPMANAQAVLARVASRGIAVFYLSRRPIGRLETTKWWLERHGFPPGAGLYLCDRDEDRVPFKIRIIQELQKDYTFLFGVGDQPTDAESYTICGIPSLHIETASDWLAADRRIQEIFAAANAGRSAGRGPGDAEFADSGRNPYFNLHPGCQTVLESGARRLTVTVLDETRDFAGIPARAVEEREEADGRVTKLARSYYTIGVDTSDVFSLLPRAGTGSGEEVASSPAAGSIFDRPFYANLFLPGRPRRGMRYFREATPGTARGRVEILGLSVRETAVTPDGTFTGCLKIRERSEETGQRDEILTFAPGIGLVRKDDLLLARRRRATGAETPLPLN